MDKTNARPVFEWDLHELGPRPADDARAARQITPQVGVRRDQRFAATFFEASPPAAAAATEIGAEEWA